MQNTLLCKSTTCKCKEFTITHCELFLFYFCIPKTKQKRLIMKIKLTAEQIKAIVDDPEKAAEAKIKVSDPWWVIVLKVVKYICEILLVGAGGFLAASCAHSIGIL